MEKVEKVKMTKDIIPVGFTYSMVLVDMFPVLFFGGTAVLLGMIMENIVVITGAIISFVSGLIKVYWKYIVVKEKKNIWWMFKQMRILMPVGMLMVITGLVISSLSGKHPGVFKLMCTYPQSVFFVLGILGMMAMIYCGMKLDSSNPKSNWIEQTINSVAQGAIFVGMLLTYIGLH